MVGSRQSSVGSAKPRIVGTETAAEQHPSPVGTCSCPVLQQQ